MEDKVQNKKFDFKADILVKRFLRHIWIARKPLTRALDELLGREDWEFPYWRHPDMKKRPG